MMTEAQALYHAARARWKAEYTDSLSAREIPSGWRGRFRRVLWHPLVACVPFDRLRAYLQAWRAVNATYGL